MDPYMMAGQQQQQTVYPQSQSPLLGTPWATNPYAYSAMASAPTASYASANPMSLFFGSGGTGGYPLFSNLLGR